MPHLTIEYSANIEDAADIPGLCAAMRDAMVETGIFPLGGIRVRAFPCHTWVIADGAADYGYLHMIARVGHGRPEDIRAAAAETLYSAAEAWLKPRMAHRPFALSLDLDELHPVTSLKRFNTVHAHLAART